MPNPVFFILRVGKVLCSCKNRRRCFGSQDVGCWHLEAAQMEALEEAVNCCLWAILTRTSPAMQTTHKEK